MSEATLPISDPEMDLDEEVKADASDEKEYKTDKRSYTRQSIIFQEGNSAVPTRNWSVAKAKIKIETTTTLEFE